MLRTLFCAEGSLLGVGIFTKTDNLGQKGFARGCAAVDLDIPAIIWYNIG